MIDYTPQLAKIYDKILFPAMHRIRKNTVKAAKNLQTKKIIDLCCGTGNQLKYFKKAGFTDIYGVDLSQAMINQANKGKYKTTCLLEDATKTHFSDNFFDMSMVTLALHEKTLETAKKIIDEAFRITKNNGYFTIIDYCFDEKTKNIGKKIIDKVEAIMGGSHYENFKNYIKTGGMNFLMNGHPYIIEQYFVFKSIRLRIFKIKK
jgi:demethylmenaquinone methyltransferase/2-methoxy-6-polyprenyl-1,4-benzoquinol methylase